MCATLRDLARVGPVGDRGAGAGPGATSSATATRRPGRPATWRRTTRACRCATAASGTCCDGEGARSCSAWASTARTCSSTAANGIVIAKFSSQAVPMDAARIALTMRAVVRAEETPCLSAGSSGSTAAAPSPTSSRAGPTARCVTHKLLSENPEHYARRGASPASADLLGLKAGAADPGRARSKRVKMGTTVATNALLERKGEPHAAGHHARLPRRAAHRLPEPAAPLRPPHRAARAAVRARGRGRRARRRARRGGASRSTRRQLRARSAGAPTTPASARVRHRVHARLPLSPRTSGGRASSRARSASRRSRVSHEVSPLMKLVGARRHHGGRRLPVADPAPLRRPGRAASCRACGCCSCSRTAA